MMANNNNATNTSSTSKPPVDADDLFMKLSVPELNVYERRTRYFTCGLLEQPAFKDFLVEVHQPLRQGQRLYSLLSLTSCRDLFVALIH